MTAVYIILLYDFAKGFGQSVIEVCIARKMLPKLRTTVYRTKLVYILIVIRKLIPLTIQYTHNHIIYLNRQTVKTSLVLQMSEMS